MPQKDDEMPRSSAQLRQHLARRLQVQDTQKLRRKLVAQPLGHRRRYNFSSNDYLGLNMHPEVLAAYQQGVADWGAGAGASPLVTGYTKAHEDLCEQLADWLGVEQIVLFNSGFSANQGVLQVLLQAGASPVIDKLCHASIYDGLGHGFRQTITRFQHNNYADLRAKVMKVSEKACPLIVSEGVFSMDGDKADLAQLSLTKKQGLLMLDDAHGIGVTGSNNKGVFDHINAGEIDVVTGTFGKAFGVAGAFVATDKAIAQSVIQNSRHLIYSTAFAPAQARAISAGLSILQRDQRLQLALGNLIDVFKQKAADLNLRLLASDTPIQPLLVGDNALALRLSEALLAAGFQCTAIRPPTVPKGTARIRFTLSLHQSVAAIDELFTAIENIFENDPEIADACRIQ